jgi:hypothetical protein
MSNAIGDSLISMIIVRNMMRGGLHVTVFGKVAHGLRAWFPDVLIEPLPSALAMRDTLASFHTVIQMQHNQPVVDLIDCHSRVLTLHEVEFGSRTGCMAERFADFCRRDLGLSDVSLDNGVSAPAGLRHRHHRNRVVIHPEASTEDKRWPAAQFVRLARRLEQRGFEPHFVIAPHERARWVALLDAHNISAPVFPDLDSLASWVYESGWFIGNDSGVGHMASNFGLPTISLFRRRRVSERWRPVWGTTRVVLSWQWVPTSYLKERFWRETLTLGRVLSVFSRLVRDEAGGG